VLAGKQGKNPLNTGVLVETLLGKTSSELRKEARWLETKNHSLVERRVGSKLPR